MQGGGSQRYNLGNGNGFSVQEVIDAARRDGDPARLVADATLARQQLGWTPQFPELDTLVAHAWGWEQKVAVRPIRLPCGPRL